MVRHHWVDYPDEPPNNLTKMKCSRSDCGMIRWTVRFGKFSWHEYKLGNHYLNGAMFNNIPPCAGPES